MNLTKNYNYDPISIHTLRAEGDCLPVLLYDYPGNISIHTLRAEGDYCGTCGWNPAVISIHTLRAEGDKAFLPVLTRKKYFNPHPPCGG